MSTPATAIAHVVLDFDGTCTQIPAIFEDYLEHYRVKFNDLVEKLSPSEWADALQAVRAASPRAAWMLTGCPAAPAAADPYILADEAAKYVLRARRSSQATVPASLNAEAYAAFPAPWREDALETFVALMDRGVRIHIVSNSSTALIEARLRELFATQMAKGASINVQSDAGKFRICELPWDAMDKVSDEGRKRFVSLPAAFGKQAPAETTRPVYIRRGAYFQAIWRVLEGRLDELGQTVFCGDIWEMDLAMPFQLGGLVHLIERAAPFDTYGYERQVIESCGQRGKFSQDLKGLLSWCP